ncbi:eukaryotic type KH-domain type I [Hyaloraphidium curvatum]|nr:eukaryotic type KH-domain type I [Hyaloraphidium curvatum]
MSSAADDRSTRDATPVTPAEGDAPPKGDGEAKPAIRRKRKWDLDDSGREVPPEPSAGAAAADSAKADGDSAARSERDDTPSKEAKDMAAEAAAKINQLLQAKGALPAGGSSGIAIEPASKRIKEAPFSTEIDINDIRNRYVLTKGETQRMLHDETGADVSTRGRYYPDRRMANDREPPLHLHIQAPTQESLDKAVARVRELIDSGMTGREASPPLSGANAMGANRMSIRDRDPWPEDKVYIGIDDSAFVPRAKVVGPGGSYVKHIQSLTGTRVQVKGRGSNFIETSTGREADDELHVHIAGPSIAHVLQAKGLVEDLVATVKEEYAKWKAERAPRRPAAPMAGYGAYPGMPGYGMPAAGAAYGMPGYGAAQAVPSAPGVPGAPGTGQVG